MFSLRYFILECIVNRHEATGEPVTETEVAAAFGLDRDEMAPPLDALRSSELLATTDGGLRPTVTGEELVALPTQGEFLVVDECRGLTAE